MYVIGEIKYPCLTKLTSNPQSLYNHNVSHHLAFCSFPWLYAYCSSHLCSSSSHAGLLVIPVTLSNLPLFAYPQARSHVAFKWLLRCDLSGEAFLSTKPAPHFLLASLLPCFSITYHHLMHFIFYLFISLLSVSSCHNLRSRRIWVFVCPLLCTVWYMISR